MTFTVAQLDLTAGSISIAPQTSITFGSENGVIANSLITANGKKLDDAASLTATISSKDNSAVTEDQLENWYKAGKSVNDKGAYSFRLVALDGQEDVIGSTTVDTAIVQQLVTYYYGKDQIKNGQELVASPFDAALGTTFTTNAISAGKIGETTPAFTTLVTKDGVEVTDFAAAGEYKLVIDTPVAADYSYAGHAEAEFTVSGKDYTGSMVYAFVDGKHLANDAQVVYTGNAVEPTVVVKDAKNNTLVEGTDYTVTLTDAAGNIVESAVEVGEYNIIVTFNGEINGELNAKIAVPFEIVKAEIKGAKATNPYFALAEDGSAVTPDFVLNTQADLKGQTFAMSDVETAVTYYKATWKDSTTGENADGEVQFSELTKGDVIRAEDLTEVGYYIADINVLSTSKNFKGGAEAWFALTDKVSFDDVDANAWYADEVYQAAQNGYVKGMGNNLFFPEAQMTRAQFAQVLFNMAGELTEAGSHPTQFADVDGDAWYAQAVSWAVEAGVVKGTSETTFDPEGTITREQIATMLYRYAGNGAQADLSILDEFVDGGEVCDWAETAMAWAVESGYMNGKGANDLQPHANATRAEVAALAVRVQPEPIEKPII